jgi:putative tryptophan/tyrosine transport system substrate-binding protein
MRRREFIALLGGAAAGWPLAARAQQSAMPVIGFLCATTAQGYAAPLTAFRRGLDETGFIEGRNVAIEYGWAEDQNDRLPALAAGLVRNHVTVIVAAGSTPAALAAKAATSTIPIIFYIGVDPVEAGLVGSLARPGGNITGVTTLNAEVVPKRLQLVHELVPTATAIALLVNPTSPTLAETSTKEAQVGAQTLGLQLHVLHASTERDLDEAFRTAVQLRAGGLVISPDASFNSLSKQFGSLTLRYNMPTIYQFREFAAAGGLLSYGGDVSELNRQLGIVAGRILHGEKPADVPVQQSTKMELFINLKTAKALGITIPLALLGRANEVIE